MYIYNSLCLHLIYILRGLMPTRAAIKGCYSNCVWRSDPLSLKLNTPHPEQLIKKMIVRGLKPSTAVIKGCYSNCARWSDPFQLNTPSQTINRIRHSGVRLRLALPCSQLTLKVRSRSDINLINNATNSFYVDAQTQGIVIGWILSRSTASSN